jgi:hypothetical protein
MTSYELATPGTFAVRWYDRVFAAELVSWPYLRLVVPWAGGRIHVGVEVLGTSTTITGLDVYFHAFPSRFVAVVP